jgi:Tol biopolymer transport system component
MTLGILLTGICAVHAQTDSDDPDLVPRTTSEKPAVSPDGFKLLFVSNASGKQTVWIAARDGSAPRPLLSWPGSVESDPSWSPDGSRILFSSTRGENRANIWSVSADGSGPVQLTSNAGQNTQPKVSPDGRLIAFLSNRTGKRELWLMNLNGTGQKPIALQTSRINDLSWSPDSRSLVFVGCTPPTSCNLFSITTDATASNRITTGDVEDWSPAWSAGGIAFVSNRIASRGLWIVQPNGTGLRLLTSSGGYEPVWDSDGRIIFSRGAEGDGKAGSHLWEFNSGGAPVQLTRVRGFITDGDLNVDGENTCEDLAIARASFGKKAGQARFDTRADVNSSGTVDVRDLAVVTKALPAGTTCR